MKRLLVLLFVFLCYHSEISAQTIYSVDREGTWLFNYVPSRKSSQYNNQIINQLALAHKKFPAKTAFTFFYNYHIKVNYQQNSQLDVLLRLSPSICTGDVFVHDFDLSKVLVPANCTFTISIIDPVKGELFSSGINAKDLENLKQDEVVASFPDSLWTEGTRVLVMFSRFDFSATTYQKAEKELYYIRDYVAAATLADTLEQRLKKARVSNHSPGSAFRHAIFGTKCLLLLNEAATVKSEILPGSDPRRLKEKLQVNSFRFDDLMQYLAGNGIGEPMSGNMYSKSGEAYAEMLRDALNLAKTTDYYSSPFFYRLYTNCINASQLLEFEKKLKRYATEHQIQAFSPVQLSRAVNAACLSVANQLIAQERYAEAVDILASGVKFAGANPLVAIPDTMQRRLLEARGGLTASYSKVVKKALQNSLPGLAEQYLAEASAYALKYNLTDSESNGLTGLYQQMVDLYVKSAGNYLMKSDYSSALAEYDKVSAIASAHDGIRLNADFRNGVNKAVGGIFNSKLEKATAEVQKGELALAENTVNEALEFNTNFPAFQADLTRVDSLNKSIAQQKYNLQLQYARLAQRDHQQEKLVTALSEAARLDRSFKLNPHPDFDTLVNQSAIPYIGGLYSQGRLKLWADQPEEALMIAHKANQLAQVLSVEKRETIQYQHDELMRLADESLCSKVKGELKSLIGQAEAQLNKNHFGEASMLVSEARELIYTKSFCGLNTIELNKMLLPYRSPMQWNEMHKKALSLIDTGAYNEGISLLQESGAVYQSYRLDTLGLANTGLFEIAESSSEPTLINYAVGYYIARNKFDEALQLVEKLRVTGAIAEDTRGFQESLARGLAQRDLAETDELNLKTMLRIYTGGDKWYKVFTNGYTFYVKDDAAKTK